MYLGLSDYFKPRHNFQGNHTKKDTKVYTTVNAGVTFGKFAVDQCRF